MSVYAKFIPINQRKVFSPYKKNHMVGFKKTINNKIKPKINQKGPQPPMVANLKEWLKFISNFTTSCIYSTSQF